MSLVAAHEKNEGAKSNEQQRETERELELAVLERDSIRAMLDTSEADRTSLRKKLSQARSLLVQADSPVSPVTLSVHRLRHSCSLMHSTEKAALTESAAAASMMPTSSDINHPHGEAVSSPSTAETAMSSAPLQLADLQNIPTNTKNKFVLQLQQS